MAQNTYYNSIDIEDEQLKAISHSPLFMNCDIDQIRGIIDRYGYFEKFAKNQYIFDKNSTNHRLCILISGEVVVVRKTADKEVILNNISQNMMFGFASLFAGNEGFVSDVRASKNSVILSFDEDNLTSILKDNFNICKNYIAYLTRRVRFLNSKINSFTEPSPEIRVARFIYDEYSKSGCLKIYSNATKIADSLNISRQTLYRAFDILETEQIIKKQYKFIEIINLNLLEDFLNQ
ncbi:MAG: Crp/Fnr family transcriptional regulator [Oscillospiraceae bacterium]|nr:Crp/Fnr family transcriptional regulator [Oscillospiraceae bacterium]